MQQLMTQLGAVLATEDEAKGVIADETGRIVASAARPHTMQVPQPGWAEQRPNEEWWGGFVTLSQRLLAESRIDAGERRRASLRR